MVKLGLHTCLQEPEERGGSGNITGGGGAHGSSGGIGSGSGNVGGSTGGSSGIFTSSGVGVVSGAPTPSPSSGSIGTPSGVPNTGYSASSASTPGGVGMAGGGGGAGVGAGEEVLPLGVASVLWELECCAAQARITLMNLNEGRPNHFGVFRAGVCVEEIRMLEEKVCVCVHVCVDVLTRSFVMLHVPHVTCRVWREARHYHHRYSVLSVCVGLVCSFESTSYFSKTREHMTRIML